MPPEQQEEARNGMIRMVRDQINPYIAAGWSFLDELIDPAETRTIVARAFESSTKRKMERPWRKHGVLPV